MLVFLKFLYFETRKNKIKSLLVEFWNKFILEKHKENNFNYGAIFNLLTLSLITIFQAKMKAFNIISFGHHLIYVVQVTKIY